MNRSWKRLWNYVRLTALAAVVGIAPAVGPTHADEGMWLFNDLPRQQLAERYGFEPTDE